MAPASGGIGDIMIQKLEAGLESVQACAEPPRYFISFALLRRQPSRVAAGNLELPFGFGH
jgi:hypothetical protein